MAVLTEVHYLSEYESMQIPTKAAELYEKNDMFHKFVTNLDLIVVAYNKIRQTVLEVEFPIIEGQLVALDTMLDKAENEIDWTNEGRILTTVIAMIRLFHSFWFQYYK